VRNLKGRDLVEDLGGGGKISEWILGTYGRSLD